MVKRIFSKGDKTIQWGKVTHFFLTNDGKKTGYAHAQNKAVPLRYTYHLKNVTQRS